MSSKKSLKLGFKQLNFNLSEKQELFLEIMRDKETRIVFLSGPAGSSKTFLALYSSLEMFNKDSRKKILYLRSPIESADRSLGALKGTLSEKISPYLSIVYDKIEEILDKQSFDILQSSELLRGDVINFLRGKTFLDTYVTLDESQNLTKKEILLTISRIGLGSKIFFCADETQSDIKQSGFAAFNAAFNNEESRELGIHCLQFDKEDIVRDELIKHIIDVYERKIMV